MTRLDKISFLSTCGKKMIRQNSDGNSPIPFWSYFDSIPQEDFDGHDCSEGRVEWVWRSQDEKFEHILVSSAEDEDVFMAIVLDLSKNNVFGHCLLNFKKEYGLE